MTNNKVAIEKCDDYNAAEICDILKKECENLGIGRDYFFGKNVVIKPNLLLGYSPDRAATTHPSVVEGVIMLAKEYGAAGVSIAESPGGPYSELTLRGIYRCCGMEDVANRQGIPLNYDTEACFVSAPQGEASKNFHIIKPLCEADVIINVCKLKTHVLAKMTAASKNLFGAIPGTEKFEMHARFSNPVEFFRMIIDLDQTLMSMHPVLNICDAVTGMEGNGPSGGVPRKIGAIMMSESPYALDLAASAVIGLEGLVELLREANRRGLVAKSSDELEILGEPIKNIKISDFIPPDTKSAAKFNLIPKWLKPRPEVDRKKCAGCGVCVKSCPAHTIRLSDRKAKIDVTKCIRCFCCQELCTFKAIKVKKNILFKIFR